MRGTAEGPLLWRITLFHPKGWPLPEALRGELEAEGVEVKAYPPQEGPSVAGEWFHLSLVIWRAENPVPSWLGRVLEAQPPLQQQWILLEEEPLPRLPLPKAYIAARLPVLMTPEQIASVVRNAVERLFWMAEAHRLSEHTNRQTQHMEALNRIGAALSSERELSALLELILLKSREITSADAGSLYLVEEKEGEERYLRFVLTQNDSIPVDYKEATMPLSWESIAGYVALTGVTLRLDDVYHLPPDAEFRFNRSFDERTGYRTKSMLVVPMKNVQGEVLGVIQLINRKRSWEVKLTSPEVVERTVIPFTATSESLVRSLASQAAVALENNRLYASIENLFEGFVKAAVYAIEARDPSTSGHSERVAVLTLALADVVDKERTGPYAHVHFTPQQLKELRYAAILHDVGKIGVREHVLVKAKKLYEHHLALVEERFEFVKRSLETEYTRRKMDYLLQRGTEGNYQEYFRALDEEFQRELQLLDEYFQTILLANEPTILEEGSFERLVEIAGRTYLDIYGNPHRLLQPEEVRILSIRRGSLDEEERREIESHVTKSYLFLRQIPWTKDLKQVPEIAYGHHEKLDGSGYPRGLRGEEIPIQTRMMTVCDIYDALTAADRPYKKAVSVERALDILRYEVEDGHIDRELVRLFIEGRVFEKTRGWKLRVLL